MICSDVGNKLINVLVQPEILSVPPTGSDFEVVFCTQCDLVVSVAVTGSLFRMNMGLKGFVAGGSIGASLG